MFISPPHQNNNAAIITDSRGKLRAKTIRLDFAFGPFVSQYIRVVRESNFYQNNYGLELASPKSGA
jgi:hypothetical protein